MNVGVGRRDGPPVDMHNKDVRIGRAYVVLDRKPAPDLRRRCFEPRMSESKLRGAIEPGHERPDTGASHVVEAVHPRAVDLLDSGRRGDPIDPLVQIHSEQMEAVGAVAPRRGEANDLSMSDAISPEIRQGLEDRFQARLERRQSIRLRNLDGLDHRLEIVRDSGRQ